MGGAGGICVASHIVGTGDAAACSTSPSARAEIDASLRDVYATLFLTASPTLHKAALNLLGHDAGALPPADGRGRRGRDRRGRAMLERHGLLAAGRHGVSGTLRVLPLGGRRRDRQEHDGRRVRRPDRRRRLRACASRPPRRWASTSSCPTSPTCATHVDDIEAIVITHGHEDHLGALPWVLRELGETSVPVIYGGQLTVAMARSKLDEHKLREAQARGAADRADGRRRARSRSSSIHLTHSIPDCVRRGAALPSSGTVLFTGDYKFDQTPVGGAPADVSRLAELGREGLLLLCGDSTNADRPGIVAQRVDGRARTSSASSRAARAGSSSPASPRTSTASSRSSTPPRRSDRKVAWSGARCARTSTSAARSATSTCRRGC